MKVYVEKTKNNAVIKKINFKGENNAVVKQISLTNAAVTLSYVLKRNCQGIDIVSSIVTLNDWVIGLHKDGKSQDEWEQTCVPLRKGRFWQRERL